MVYSMSRGSSSEGSSCYDHPGPLTPEFTPSRELLDIKHGLDIHLERSIEHIRLDYTSYTPPSYSIPHCSTPNLVPTIRRVCFIGAGYVGGPTASVLALHNPQIRFDVVDKNTARIKGWKSCSPPIHEPGLEKIVRVARDGANIIDSTCADNLITCTDGTTFGMSSRQPNLFFSSDIGANVSEADMIFLAVNTPTKSYGAGSGKATDMSIFDMCIDEVIRYAKTGAIIVEKSTVPCGTALRILKKLQIQKPGTLFEVLSNPEFLAEGSAVKDLLEPDRIIIGSSSTLSGRKAARMLAQLYSWVPRDKILTSNTWSSELSKLVANAMLAQRISSINSISAICERTDADINEITQAVGHDVRIGSKFLQSGLGFGGSCFRKDIASLAYIAESLGLEDIAHYWAQVNIMNESQRKRFTSRVIQGLDNNLVGKKIALLGFAFKKNTGDVRESIAIDIIKILLEELPAEIAIYDPYCRADDIAEELSQNIDRTATVNQAVKVYTSPYTACARSDAILITTDCDQFLISDQDTISDLPNSEMQHLKHSNTNSPHLSSPSSEDKKQLKVKSLNSIVTYRLLELQPCTSTETCPRCQKSHLPLEQNSQTLSHSSAPETTGITKFRLDWTAIIQSTNQPSRIFDGRHVLKREHVEGIAAKLGRKVILESVGLKSRES